MSSSKEVRRAYYQRNKEKLIAASKTRYLKNKEQLLEYQREYRKANPELILERTRRKRLERLQLGINLLGGKCAKCGGVFDPCQYDFHHVNPEEKEFTIGENVLIGEARFISELKKCVLLCANCHRLEHKELTIDSRKV